MRTLFKIIVVFYGLVISPFVLAGLAVNISPSSIQLGETFRLTLTLDAMHNHANPDLTPLLQEFDIQGTERNISYTVISGQARALSQWSIILKPKKMGTLIIPAIHIGTEQSLASQIVVQQNTYNTGLSSDEAPKLSLFLANTNLTKPFINQQVTYTVRLLTQQRLLDAQYHPPQVDDALLMPLGDGRHYQTQFKGQAYEVEEQQYAIFPQKEGVLTISPPALDAMAFGDNGPTRIRLEAKALTLQVSSHAVDPSMKHWLPASAVELEESYDTDKTDLLEGDTIVRTIVIKTKNLPAQLLPALTFNNTASFHVYKEKPSTENHVDNGDLWGSTTIQITYLLSQSGQTTLPAINIPWFNTVTNQQEIASLPKHPLNVKIRTGDSSSLSQPAKTVKESIATSKVALGRSNAYIMGIIGAILGLIGVLYVGFLAWQTYQRRVSVTSKETDKILSLQKACKANDPHQARAALIQWAKNHWPHLVILNLNDIPMDDTAFKAEIERLSQALYASRQHKWAGDGLWRCIHKFKPSKTKKKNNMKLPPMNPTTIK